MAEHDNLLHSALLLDSTRPMLWSLGMCQWPAGGTHAMDFILYSQHAWKPAELQPDSSARGHLRHIVPHLRLAIAMLYREQKTSDMDLITNQWVHRC